MLDSIRRFVIDRVVRSPDPAAGEPAPSRVEVAACALLLELAHADGEFSPEERQHLESSLVQRLGLDRATGVELIRLAEAERAESVDHFQFTRLIAAEYDLSEKLRLAEVMWGVILADGRLTDHEAHLVRKMASLMELEPAYLAQARDVAVAKHDAHSKHRTEPGGL
jgi:uncharacterized tellurite resistance protein B-like protein